MTRDILPSRRPSVSFTVSFEGERYDVSVGYYNDARVGEIFITRKRDKTSAKVGSEHLDGVCRDTAIVMSLAIQHGASLTTIQHAVTRDEDGTPATLVGAIIDHMALDEGVINDPHSTRSSDITRRSSHTGTPSHDEPPTDPRRDDPNTGTAELQLGPRSPSDSGGTGDAKELPSTPERTSPRCEWCGEDLGDSDVDAMRG